MKLKINALNFFSLVAILFSSCTTYLTPAILGNNIAYLPKSMVADSLKSLTSLSGSYAVAVSPDGDISYEMGMANLSRAHTFKDFNIAYGAYGYFGKASNGGTITSPEDSRKYLQSFSKSISGLGFRLSTGLSHTSTNGNTDFRYVNFENALSIESGNYTKFREQIYNSDLPDYVAVTRKKVLWTTGLSTEVIWQARHNHDIKHSFRLFMGGTPGLVNSFKYGSANQRSITEDSSFGFSLSYHLLVHRFSFCFETANRVNLSEKFTLGYCF
ncbi:hypothetical protein [Pedobacter frigidisoli]|uniref:hypothetical protein n=1 Tax=Pedobacter frigidisoli TaxID=2530455 RepID=UPI00292FDEEE|nr:hypothetical protein [Pedobacter frigidisoli]